MTYAVKADMQAEFGDTDLAQLTDRVNGQVTDDAVLNGALVRADEEIDSYLAQRYTLPFASAPARLRSIAMDMARYYLSDARAPQIVQDRYKAAVAWLKDVAAGKAVVGVDVADNLITPPVSAVVAVVASDAVFTDELLCRT